MVHVSNICGLSNSFLNPQPYAKIPIMPYNIHYEIFIIVSLFNSYSPIDVWYSTFMKYFSPDIITHTTPHEHEFIITQCFN